MITNKELNEINLSPTKKDYYQIWNELLELADKISERWSPASTNESDPGIVLLKALTAIADKLNYNIDKNTLEAFMPSATQEESMRKLTEMMGYNMKYYQSATCKINISYKESNNKSINQFGNGILIPKFTNIKNQDEDINYLNITSPQNIVLEIKFNNMNFKTKPCKNTLYSWIYKGFFPNLEIKHLNMKSKEKKKRRNVVAKRPPRGTSIEHRPKEILERKTFGHWEMDCVCGSSNSTLLVLTERLTRKEIIMKMPNQKSESVIHSLNILETKYGKMFRKIFLSITVDNGSEFADSIALESSKTKRFKRTKLYYCHPYCSSERGTNERLNREIRRLIPKGSNISLYTTKQIKQVENWLNNYPRSVLGYATSQELFDNQLKILA